MSFDTVGEHEQLLMLGEDPKIGLSLPYFSARHVEDLRLLLANGVAHKIGDH